MYDLVSGCSAGFIDKKLCLDLCEDEEEVCSSHLVVGMMSGLGQITHLVQTGKVDQEDCFKGMDLCVDACHQINGVMQSVLLKQA